MLLQFQDEGKPLEEQAARYPARHREEPNPGSPQHAHYCLLAGHDDNLTSMRVKV